MKRAWSDARLSQIRTLGSAPLPGIKNARSRARVAAARADPAGRGAFVAELYGLVRTVRDQGLQPTTHQSYGSMVSFFEEFCVECEVDMSLFGASEVDGGMSPADEDELLAMFAVFVVVRPRKGSKDHNSGDYGGACVTAVRNWCEKRHHRRPGTVGRGHTLLPQLLKGLRKMYPSDRPVRLPILQQHLRRVQALLDLEGSPYHRVLWAFWLTCWQGVCRCSDLIRGKKVPGRGPWSAERDTSRASLTSSVVSPPDAPAYVRLTLRMKPNKTNPTAETAQEKTFPIQRPLPGGDPASTPLSSGAALADMLAGDPTAAGLDEATVPLFRDPRPGKNGAELSWVDASAELRRVLLACGLAELAHGAHSLRIGGATAAANDPTGGDMVAMFMGFWVSKSRFRYTWALRDRIERTSMSMACGVGGELAVRPGPVAAYATA